MNGERLYAGIDIGATNIKFGLVDSTGTVAFRAQAPTPRNGPAEKLFDAIVICGERLLIEADERNARVDYIGVGSPGSVNMKTGIIQGSCPNIPYWVGFHLRDRLAERLNLHVIVDNDANCAALAEHRFGAGQGYTNIICLTIGTGIGGGIIINGRVYRGADYSAGEIGHMLLPEHDGNEEGQAYLETRVSAKTILSGLKERLASGLTPAFQSLVGNDLGQLTIRKVFLAVKKGDAVALEVLGDKARMLGRSLASLANVLNPELVILGGGVAEGGSVFVDIVRETVLSHALPVVAESLEVVPAMLGNAAGLIGAAFLGGEEER